MTVLEEIQNEAVDSKSDLGALLRKCKVLAARLGSKQLQDWLIWESNGYPACPFGSGARMPPLLLMNSCACEQSDEGKIRDTSRILLEINGSPLSRTSKPT